MTDVEALVAELKAEVSSGVSKIRSYPAITDFQVPMTSSRLLSLLGDEGQMFSARTLPQRLDALLSPVANVRSLIIMGSNDEYLSPGIDAISHTRLLLKHMSGFSCDEPQVNGQMTWMAASINHTGVVVSGADHSFQGHEELLAGLVLAWLS